MILGLFDFLKKEDDPNALKNTNEDMQQRLAAAATDGTALAAWVFAAFAKTDAPVDEGGNVKTDIPGYLGLTQGGQLIIMRGQRHEPVETEVIPLAEATEVLVSEPVLGRNVQVTWDDHRYRMGFTPKVLGNRFPDQGPNVEKVLEALKKQCEALYGTYKEKKWNLIDDAD